jgi:hypothetical protein
MLRQLEKAEEYMLQLPLMNHLFGKLKQYNPVDV